VAGEAQAIDLLFGNEKVKLANLVFLLANARELLALRVSLLSGNN